MVSKNFNDKRSRDVLSPLFFFVCLCQFFCSVTSVFFFQQAKKSLFCDCSLCDAIKDIVEEMKVKNRGERKKCMEV